ncbi:MAG: hypothetical protein DHS20C15_21650 [Planctomycetota bacterium]|nr:MAG: hypothetical protein DHS20C15_21650 [Planctomycetota bacterium]
MMLRAALILSLTTFSLTAQDSARNAAGPARATHNSRGVSPTSTRQDASLALERDRLLFGGAITPIEGGLLRSLLDDLDGDLHLDIVLTDVWNSALWITPGLGNGDFGTPRSMPVGALPTALVSGDLNQDGHTDLLVTNRISDDLHVLLGRGDGRFADAVIYTLPADPLDIALGDVDLDGDLDVVVAAAQVDTLVVWLNRGDGSLQSAPGPVVGFGVNGIDLGDYDGDGRLDVGAVSSDFKRSIFLRGDGKGSFVRPQLFEFGAFDVRFAPLSGSGTLEAVLSTGVALLVLHGQPDGTLKIGRSVEASNGAFLPLVVDLDSNGTLDLLSLDVGKARVEAWLGTGGASFRAGPTSSVLDGETAAVGDLDHDGRPDVVVGSYADGISVALGADDGTLRTGDVIDIPDQINTGGVVAAADLDRDGFLDLVKGGSFGGDLWLMFGAEGASFGAPIRLDSAPGVRTILTEDLDHDGDLDLIAAVVGDRVLVSRNEGKRRFQPALAYVVDDSPTDVAAGDLDGDGILDLVTSNDGSDSVSILRGRGDATFFEATSHPAGSRPMAVELCDFNADGILDLAVVNWDTDTVTVQRGTGSGSFFAAKQYAVGHHPEDLDVADLDEDGRSDLVVTTTGAGDLTLLRGEAGGAFSAWQTLASELVIAYDSLLTDVDLDGHVDLVALPGNSDNFTLRLGRGDGSFQTELGFAGGFPGSGAAAGDVNGDARPELILPRPSGFTVLRNRP